MVLGTSHLKVELHGGSNRCASYSFQDNVSLKSSSFCQRLNILKQNTILLFFFFFLLLLFPVDVLMTDLNFHTALSFI